MSQPINLHDACEKLNMILQKSPHTASALLNLNLTIPTNEAITSPMMCYPMGDNHVINVLSLISSLGDGSSMLVPAATPYGAIGVRVVPVNNMQEETK